MERILYTTKRGVESKLKGGVVRLFTTATGLRCYLDLIRTGKQPLDHVGTTTTTGQRATPPVNLTIGLVPTMGALHAGHLSLIQRAREENDLVVVSIFVNPLQFGPNEDLAQYPRPLEQDQQLCQQAGVDAVFAPTVRDLYGKDELPEGDRLTQVIPPAAMVAGLCGRSRPGHFQGVATVVTKLLQIVQPQRAYFGQKDAQQLAILRRLVNDLNIAVEIVPCPIVREANGLALSSRNQYLTIEQRQQAAVLHRSLCQARQLFCSGIIEREGLIDQVKAELATVPEIEPDYVDLVHPHSLEPIDQIESAGLLAIAAHIGTTRLIDNMVLHNRRPIVAIDGPAGAGKSTVVRQVAQALGLLYLDTGAMYRAVTWLVQQSGIALDDRAAIAELVSQCEIQLASGHNDQPDAPPAPCRVWINQYDVTQAIRSLEVTANVSAIAAQPDVRHELVKQQQRYGRKGGIVMEGRDIGTYVFPNAELKIFLTASVQERARRRQRDLQQQGQTDISLDELERTIQLRDDLDSSRSLAPLRKAGDAVEIDTDQLTIAEVTAKIIDLYQERTAQF